MSKPLTDDGYPVMLCEPVRPRLKGNVWQWRFRCPHCGVFHYHGAMPGHRVRHCHRPNSPYERTGYVLRLDPKFQVAGED
jgi:hypothetical protein